VQQALAVGHALSVQAAAGWKYGNLLLRQQEKQHQQQQSMTVMLMSVDLTQQQKQQQGQQWPVPGMGTGTGSCCFCDMVCLRVSSSAASGGHRQDCKYDRELLLISHITY
jgi:hypothetical protein